MPKRLQTNADKELLEEVGMLLAPGDRPPSITQLERWRQGGYIPSAERHGLGRGRGTKSSYPAGTAVQVVALMREQDVRPRPRLEKAVLPLFLAGHRIRLDTLRRALIDEANRVRQDAEILAGTRRSRREGRPNQALTAARLAEKLMRGGHLSKQTRKQRKAMLDRLSKPLRWTPDDPPKTLMQDVFVCLIYAFFTGGLLPGTEDAIYRAYVAYGVESAVKNLLPRIGFEIEPNLDLVAANLPKVSLPFVVRTLKRMKMADFERARDDCRQVQAVFGFLADALRALFPEGVGHSVPVRRRLDTPRDALRSDADFRHPTDWGRQTTRWADRHCPRTVAGVAGIADGRAASRTLRRRSESNGVSRRHARASEGRVESVDLVSLESALATVGAAEGVASETRFRMQSSVSATFASPTCREGVCVADGYGVRVRVNRRHLVVSDGIGRHRRERVFAKALPGIKRLVVIGHEGYVTFDALRWLADAGIAFCQVDRDGKVMATSDGYGLNDARLRRALALAPSNRSGLKIARYLLSAKLAGQARVLSRAEFAEPSAATVASWPRPRAMPCRSATRCGQRPTARSPIGTRGRTSRFASPRETSLAPPSIGAPSDSEARRSPARRACGQSRQRDAQLPLRLA